MNRSRKLCIAGERCEPASMAEAVGCLLQHSEPALQGLIGPLAERGIHVSANYLYNASNPYRQDEHAHWQGRLLLPITSITGNMVAVDYIERALGRVALKVPTSTGRQVEDQALVTAVREFSESLDAYTTAIADGHVDRDEFARIERQGHEAMAAIAQLVELARQRVSESGRRVNFPRGGGAS